MRAVLPATARSLVEPYLPNDTTVAWWSSPDDTKRMIADANIAWVDLAPVALTAEAIRASGLNLKWVSTIYAGLDGFPFDL
jgi:hypothetical protein